MEGLMIEIVYREDDNSGEEISVKLPKNIKQIGDTRGNLKVYFEEMVMEMIKEKSRYGVLLGSVKRAGNCSYIFINGAVMAVNSSDSRHIDFSEKVWTAIHEDIKSYYDNPEIVGWFVSEKDKAISLDNVKRIHLDNFPGNDKICILNDISENEEKVYRYNSGLMEETGGYYIYFDKNVTFERYLTRSKALEEIFEADNKKEEVKEVISEEKEKLPRFNFKEMVPSYMVIALLLAIIVVMNNSNQINSIKTSLSDIAGNLVNTPETETSIDEDVRAVMESIAGNDVKQEETTTQKSKEQETTTQKPKEQETTTQKPKDPETTTQKPKEPETTAQIESVVEPTFYVVKSGETLSDISRTIYNDVSKVEDIMNANDIDDADMIYEGQKIVLP